MELNQVPSYPIGVPNEFGLLNPVRNSIDELLIGNFKKHRSNPQSTLFQSIFPVPKETAETLLSFSYRAAVFALRDQDPELAKCALLALAIAMHRHDPRDIVIASSRILYAAQKLGVEVPAELYEQLPNLDSHRRNMISVRFEPDRIAEAREPRSFKEVQTRFGIGLVDCELRRFAPNFDLIEAAIDIVELIKADELYLTASIKIDSGKLSKIGNVRGGIRISARPDHDALENMRHQSFHLGLVDFADESAAGDASAAMAKPDWCGAQLKMRHESMLFFGYARSFVKGIAHVETDASLKRFETPIKEILQDTPRWDPGNIKS